MLDRPTDNPSAEPEPKGEHWAFPTRSRCPVAEGGCGSISTLATHTRGRVQYRKCQACGHTYKVTGEAV